MKKADFLSDYEIQFKKRYGDFIFNEQWFSLSDEQQESFKIYENKIEQVYSICSDLFTKYHKDLEFYALMYRNIPLYHLALDAYSMMFFASKKNEIIGYHTRILNDNLEKAQIVKLYYDNKALFPKACKKHLNINLFEPTLDRYNFNNNVVLQFQENNIPKICCINSLSSNECKAILENKNILLDDYENIFDKGPWMYENIKYICHPNFRRLSYTEIFAYKNRIANFILEHGCFSFLQDIDKIKKHEENLLNSASAWEELCSLIEKGWPQKQVFPERNCFSMKSIANKALGDLSSQRRLPIFVCGGDEKRALALHAEEIQKLTTLEKEFRSTIQKIDNIQAEVSQFAETTESFKIIRNNNEVLNVWLDHFYETQYCEMWLKNAQSIRRLEASSASVDNFICFAIGNGQINFEQNKEKNKNAKEPIMGIPCWRRIFSSWYAPIRKENERIAEIEKIRREEENQREQERIRQELERKRREEEARQAQFRYNQRNCHYRDKQLSFDKESHTYTVNGKILDSVTTLIGNSFPKFDVEEHATRIAERKGITVQEVIDMWKKKGQESRDQGTLLHEKIEKYYQGIDSPEDPAYKLFKQFADIIKLKPYRTEWGVFDYELGIAGTIDFVDYQNGEYSIYDWKRSDKLIINGLPAKINQYGEKGNYPLEHLDNSPYYHYAMQLSIYKYILERNYNIKVLHLRLGIFHPSYIKPYILEMPYLEKEVKSILDLRSEIIF